MSGVPGAGLLQRAAGVLSAERALQQLRVRLVRAGVSGPRPERGLRSPQEGGRDLDLLLGMVAPARPPWLQRTVRAGRSAVGRWLHELPERAAGWGAGPDQAWCAW